MRTRLLAAWLLLLPAPSFAADDDPPQAQLRAFIEVYNALRANHVRALDHDMLMRSAINGLLKVDPHAAYLDEGEFRRMARDSRTPAAGLGLELGMDPRGVRIISVIDDAPASRADIRPGDVLLAVDGVALKGRSLAEAVKVMRGAAGTPARLTLQRGEEPQPRQVTVVRQIIRVATVRSRLLRGDVAYVRISQFQENTPDSLARQLAELFARAEPRLLVIDVRGNPGGLLRACVAAAALFLPDKALIVKTDGRNEDATREYRAVPSDYLHGSHTDPRKLVPARAREVRTAVLIDYATIAGAEIFAAALLDNNRATLLGQQTRGEATVQTLMPLRNGAALKVTTARYQSPAGRDLERVGVAPQIRVEERATGELGGPDDPVLRIALEKVLP